MEIQVNSVAPAQSAADRLGWKPNFQRIWHAYDIARASNTPDPQAVAEATCWLDLIDAELASLGASGDGAAREQLKAWRVELDSLLKNLNKLSR
jgi:hypothetical protein